MTASPPLPHNLNHLQNGRQVWFYGTRPSTAPCRGTVIGRGRDPETRLVSLTIVPSTGVEHVQAEVKGGTVKRTINAVFPDLNGLNAHHEFLEKASPDEVAAWTRQMIGLFDMISTDPQDSKY